MLKTGYKVKGLTDLQQNGRTRCQNFGGVGVKKKFLFCEIRSESS